jgi:predicted PurR-regulated permease PerM
MATILSNLELMVGGYMRGQVITSFSMGVYVFLVLSAAGVATPLPLAVFAALADVLPFVGGLLVLTPAVLAVLPMGTHVAVMVFSAMVLYQEFENRILVPRIYGKALRLPPAAVVMALLVGGKLIGMVGALIALPVAAGLVMLIEELRLEMPGRAVDADLKKLDERAAKVYVARSADATPEEAQAIAAQIAGEALEDAKPAK